MSITGPEALRVLEEALRDIRREEDEIAKRAARGAEVLLKHFAQEAALYRLLGERRFDPEERQTQDRLVAEISSKVETAISRYEAGFADAEAAVQHAEADLSRGNAERSALQSEASRHDAELSTHVAVARPRLGSDAGYAAKVAAARDLAATAEAAICKAETSEAERAAKLEPYRSDALFTYLSDRFYGTAQYASRGVFAALDARLAQLIGYDRAAAVHRSINELPLRLREHAERLQEKAREAAAEIASMESSAIDSVGGRSAREAIEALAPQIDALDKENVVLQDRRDAAIAARTDLARGSSPLYASVFEDLRELLGRPQLRQLLMTVRDEPRAEDTEVVAQLDDLAQRVKDETAEAEEYAEHLEVLASRRRDLEDIQYEIRQRGFDNPHARFSDDRLVQDGLNEFVRGSLSAPGYWDRWRQSQSWTAPGYGGPGGGWGRLPSPPTSKRLGRPRASRPTRTLTSAA